MGVFVHVVIDIIPSVARSRLLQSTFATSLDLRVHSTPRSLDMANHGTNLGKHSATPNHPNMRILLGSHIANTDVNE
jgi:hypothetical protein